MATELQILLNALPNELSLLAQDMDLADEDRLTCQRAADDIGRLRVALTLAHDTLAAFMNLPDKADAAWIEQEKEDLVIMDNVRAALGFRPWLESMGINLMPT